MPPRTFRSDGGGQGERAGGIDGVVLGVAGLPAAVEDVGVLGGVDGGEDLGKRFWWAARCQ